MLDKEYGSMQLISSAYMKELRLWPNVKSSDVKGIKAIYRFLLKCKVLKEQGKLALLDSPDTIRLIVSKFNYLIQESWNQSAVRIESSKHREADFGDLIELVNHQCKLICNSDYSKEAFSEGREKKYQTSMKSFFTNYEGTDEK